MPEAPASSVPAVLQIHPSDNVCVATRPLGVGTRIVCEDVRFELAEDVRLGTRIIKYGEPIGSLTADVPLGGYVHTHNLESDYLHTFARGEYPERAEPESLEEKA